MSKQGAGCKPPAFSIIILTVFVFFSLAPALFAPYHPKEMFAPFEGISAEHPLGTNDLGYDIFSELVFSSAPTLATGILAAAISIFLGILFGMAAGYLNALGKIAELLISIFLLIPIVPMVIVIAAFAGPGLSGTVMAIALFSWSGTARAVRAQTKHLRQLGFLESLQIMGIPHIRRIFCHLLPNLSPVIWSRLVVTAANCLLVEAGLSFLGLGDPSRTTWGGMINIAFKRGGFSGGLANWYLTPGICIMLAVLALYLIGSYLERKRQTVSIRSYLD